MRGSRHGTQRSLKQTEAWIDDADEAKRIWDEGFRPHCAHELQPGMIVLYKTEMFGFPLNDELGTTLIGDVTDDGMGTIIVSTFDRGNVETDECSECWAKAPS